MVGAESTRGGSSLNLVAHIFGAKLIKALVHVGPSTLERYKHPNLWWTRENHDIDLCIFLLA